MKATKDQIVAEANRRAVAQGWGAQPVEHFIIDVVCEGWTPPEPVDPDLLIAREAAAQQWEHHYGDKIEAQRRRDGWCDAGQAVTACRIAARMAREQERERAKVLVDQAKAIIDQHARLLARLPLGPRAEIGIEWQMMMDATASFYAKYRGEA